MDNATVLEYLQATLPQAILATSEAHSDLAITVQADALPDVARELRDNPDLRYVFLENLCAVDYLGRDPRFEMVYHLFSFDHFHRVCLKVGLPEEDPTVPSLAGLWVTATWQEREAYDLMGIIFRDHPSLERILMPEDWEGHPQRKDVPLGYEEVAFKFNEERIYAYKPFAKE